MGLSEAVTIITEMLRADADPGHPRHRALTSREVLALHRLLADATITLNQISAGVIRREGRK